MRKFTIILLCSMCKHLKCTILQMKVMLFPLRTATGPLGWDLIWGGYSQFLQKNLEMSSSPASVSTQGHKNLSSGHRLGQLFYRQPNEMPSHEPCDLLVVLLSTLDFLPQSICVLLRDCLMML